MFKLKEFQRGDLTVSVLKVSAKDSLIFKEPKDPSMGYRGGWMTNIEIVPADMRYRPGEAITPDDYACNTQPLQLVHVMVTSSQPTRKQVNEAIETAKARIKARERRDIMDQILVNDGLIDEIQEMLNQ